MWKLHLNRYLINKHGVIYDNNLHRFLTHYKQSLGYKQVSINGKKKYLHVLILEIFGKPRPTEKHEVNHKDGDKANNHISNLEWVTKAENISHSFKLGLNHTPQSRIMHMVDCRRKKAS